MHEYSVVQSLLDLCEENARANNAKKVLKVTAKIGVLSGIDAHLLETAFNSFKADTICKEAEFEMVIQPVIIHCHSCDEDFTLEKHEFLCPKCESNEVKILDGEEMYLMSLEME